MGPAAARGAALPCGCPSRYRLDLCVVWELRDNAGNGYRGLMGAFSSCLLWVLYVSTLISRLYVVRQLVPVSSDDSLTLPLAG